mmetsp:Transcript_129434/g.335692  ORF Transcript_129434/g.335692 Transcript_129434/m.335692 type:complete len:273 (+) Transcript_129434:67-885(+)
MVVVVRVSLGPHHAVGAPWRREAVSLPASQLASPPRMCNRDANSFERPAMGASRLAALVLSSATALAASRTSRLSRRQAPTSRVDGVDGNTFPAVTEPREADDGPRQACVALALRDALPRTPLCLLDGVGQRDPYKVLRIPFLSGKTRIRQAYTQVCRTEHPDKNRGKESMEWQMSRWAYQTLMDPEERARYDSARITRNALSVTEGFVAFGFAVAQSFGCFVADMAEIASKEVSNFSRRELGMLDPSSLLGGDVERMSGPSSPPVADPARI